MFKLPARRKTKDLNAALAWANEIRETKGLAPLVNMPKGIRLKSAACPLGRAIEGLVGYTYAFPAFPAFDERVVLPAPVASFVSRFDHGQYPGLEVVR